MPPHTHCTDFYQNDKTKYVSVVFLFNVLFISDSIFSHVVLIPSIVSVDYNNLVKN